MLRLRAAGATSSASSAHDAETRYPIRQSGEGGKRQPMELQCVAGADGDWLLRRVTRLAAGLAGAKPTDARIPHARRIQVNAVARIASEPMGVESRTMAMREMD